MRSIYLDHAATTPVDPDVLEAMLPYFSRWSANAGSLHSPGQKARAAVDASRRAVAEAIGARPSEIVFTGSATESNNWAIAGIAAARAASQPGGHVLVSSIEHHAVLEPAAALARWGIEASTIPVDADGLIDPEAVRAALRADTFLVSVMHANNEIGTIQPIAEIARHVRDHGAIFHADATQTLGALPVDVDALGVDLLSASAHKRYGPKGVGLLYIRQGTPIAPLLYGGAHERGRRAGTENVPGIVGFAKALTVALARRTTESERLAALRERFFAGLLAVDGARRNGHARQRLPNNVNVSFSGCDSESLLMALDMRGIAASSGSACTAGSLEPSHVLTAIGLPPAAAAGTIRLSLGRDTTEADVDETITALLEIVPAIRGTGPGSARASTLR